MDIWLTLNLKKKLTLEQYLVVVWAHSTLLGNGKCSNRKATSMQAPHLELPLSNGKNCGIVSKFYFDNTRYIPWGPLFISVVMPETTAYDRFYQPKCASEIKTLWRY